MRTTTTTAAAQRQQQRIRRQQQAARKLTERWVKPEDIQPRTAARLARWGETEPGDDLSELQATGAILRDTIASLHALAGHWDSVPQALRPKQPA